MNFVLRPELPADADAIHAVVENAFADAPHASGTEAAIVRELRRCGALTLSLVAVVEGRVIGHVAISPVGIGDGAADWYGLGPVAVVPAWQGQGVGHRLVEDALRRLRGHGAAGCVVLGEPDYYGRFGFRADPRLVLAGVPAEYFQALRFGGPEPQGAVSYHRAFFARG